MSEPAPRADGGIEVRVDGAIGGMPFAGDGAVRLADDAVEVVIADGRVTIAFSALEGACWRDGSVLLWLRGGALLRLSGTPRLAALARELVSRASALPEVTRALRTFGSHRARPGAEHDRVFAPLLAARRRAERSTEPYTRLAAFDAPALRRALDEALGALAAARCAGSAADARALRAHLDELFAPFLVALGALERAASAVRAAPEEEQLARWREWAAAAGTLFADADRCWAHALPLLGRWRVVRPPLWRRVLRLR